MKYWIQSILTSRQPYFRIFLFFDFLRSLLWNWVLTKSLSAVKVQGVTMEKEIQFQENVLP